MGLKDVGWWIKDKVDVAKMHTELAIDGAKDLTKYVVDEFSGKNTIDENNEIINRINSLNEEMQRMYSSTSGMAEKTKKEFEESQSNLEIRRKIVYKVTLQDFVETISSMKKVEMMELQEKKESISLMQKEELYIAKLNAPYENYFSLKNIILFTTGGGLGVLFGAIWKQIELEDQLKKTRQEKAELQVQCEIIKKECVKVQAMSKAFDIARETINTLSMLTDKAIENVKGIINLYGNDYSVYDENQKYQVMLMVNLALALNDLILVDVLDDKGVMSQECKKVFEKAENLINK